ncbi:MAG: DnaJ domain-containing protein [Candidatus Acidiferrales bacterium]
MKDYYAILGLDSDASTESVKLAYRRLAREAHPDRLGDKDSAAQALASSRMAELNEAYAVLSDSARRKEYDKEFRAWQAGEQVEAPLAPAPVAEPAVPAPPRARARPAADMHFSVVRQFSTQLQNELFSDKRTFRWRVQPLEGFDWAAQSSFLLASYYAALRGFATADPSAAHKFINYASLAIEGSRSMMKKNLYLFLMPFQRISEPDQVQALLRRFAGDGAQQRGVQALFVLLDVAHGRSLPCGPKIHDRRFDQLLAKLGLSK